MNRSNADIRESETQAKTVSNRITNVEKQFGFLCEGFAGYARKSARLRDKGDELSKALVTYTDTESLNHTYKMGITKFAENLAAVQDYRQAEIQRLEARVITPLMDYGTACKHARDDLKSAFAAQNKERRQKKTLDKTIDKNPSDRREIAERDLQRAGVESARTSKALEEQMDTFERKKLKDIKKILNDFVTVEMAFHAKALEMLTSSYQSLNILNEDEDLEEFRNSLRPSASSARLNNMKRTGSRTSLNSAGLTTTKSTPPTTPRRKPPAKPKAKPSSKSTPNHYGNHVSFNHHDDESDEEEDDEDEDDEDDDDNDDYEENNRGKVNGSSRHYNGYRR
ncbi:CBY1-interacting BAR domain-containing protein 1-like [Lineus longissimus]|uniref:CBY1-interacting BAR domain-containing protein 1-like n=1 Tax=Lineus longissimus TaxID=88925 RepID=UPI00315D0A68